LGIAVYPNPSTGQLFLNYPPGLIINSIAIVNEAGQVVVKLSNTNTASVEELAAGFYTLHIQTNKGTQVSSWNKL